MLKIVTKELNEIIKKYNYDTIDGINWICISKYQTLSNDFIKEFKNKVDWYLVSEFQILSEDFIKEFKDKVDWWSISVKQILSEDFIIEMHNYINWQCVSINQKLSIDFIKKYKRRLKLRSILLNKEIKIDIDEDIIEIYYNDNCPIPWNYLFSNKKLSHDFIKRHKDDFNIDYKTEHTDIFKDNRNIFKKVIKL